MPRWTAMGQEPNLDEMFRWKSSLILQVKIGVGIVDFTEVKAEFTIHQHTWYLKPWY